jgi:UDP-N-acetylmuramoyl-tripeptide--D-alanyl-D-alanine ligase
LGTAIPANEASFSIEEIAGITGGVVLRPGSARAIRGVSTDTRSLREGNAFVALRGASFDGHEHTGTACASGAALLIVSTPVDAASGTAVIQVKDTLVALGKLAKEHRRRWAQRSRAAGLSGRVVGVTGSAGKTTTCRAITAVLEGTQRGKVHSAAGNLNNAIGVPMVLLGLADDHGHAVVEIGTSHPGEIAYGASLAEPDTGVITLVACAHTEGLGSIEAVAQEKGALVASLPTDGVCVLNADDALVRVQAARSPATTKVTFGRSVGADVRVVSSRRSGWTGQDVTLEVLGKRVDVAVPLLGDAGLYATAAALAVVWGQSGEHTDLHAAGASLASLRAEAGRLRPRRLPWGALLIDDAYNANPASMVDSVRVAAELASGEGRRLVLVLGEMRELGRQSEAEHDAIGKLVGAVAPARLIAVGGHARRIADAAAAFGVQVSFAQDSAAAVPIVLEDISERDVVLVKGSRGVALERVVSALNARGEQPAR